MSLKSIRGLSKFGALVLITLVLFVFPLSVAAQGPTGKVAEPAPPSGAIEVPHSPDLDQAVGMISTALSLADPSYDVWALSASATADGTFKYYGDMLAQNGWTDKGTAGQDPTFGQYTFWKSDDGETVLVVLFIAGSGSAPVSTAIAILGTIAADAGKSAQPSTGKSAPAAGPAATPDPHALPAGKAGVAVKSFYGDEINFSINSKLYKVPANGELFIVLDPGKYNWSANIPGKGDVTDTAELAADDVLPITFGD